MWTDIARRQQSRAGLRYPSDLRDDEWALIAPFLPPARRAGRPRRTDLREVMNAILYLATSGCQWRMLPRDFPPLSTVQRYFYAWQGIRGGRRQIVTSGNRAVRPDPTLIAALHK